MHHLAVGIFHDENLGRELGKKGTESDILMFNRKTENTIFTFMCPVEDKITPKSQIISSIDAAILCYNEITPAVGETILMLDSQGISKGLIVVPPNIDTQPLLSMIKQTSLESFDIVERHIPTVMEHLERMQPGRDTMSPAVVIVDHSFSVKGVGEVILGFVKQGAIHKHDTMLLLPYDKEVIVRSIQMQDNDYDEAKAGSRVGLAIKGATTQEMKRGTLLCTPGGATINTQFTLTFCKNRFYPTVNKGLVHVTVGMQTVPARITEINDGSVSLETEKPIAYTKQDTFLFLDLNAKKLHLMGHATLNTMPSC